MARRIVWTKRAKAVFDEITLYLEYNFDEKAAIKFSKAVKNKLITIANYPESGRIVPTRKGVRFYKVGKHLNLYYKIKNDIIIVHLFDTRQDPKKNPYQ